MPGNAQPHLVTAEYLLSCPVKKPVQVGALAELNHHFGNTDSGYRLAYLIREQACLAPLCPGAEKLFVHASLAGRAVA